MNSLKHKCTTLPVGSHRGESSKVTVLDFLDSHVFDLPFFSGFKCRSAVRSPGQHGVWEAKKVQDREKYLKGEQQIRRESRRQALPTGVLPVCAVSAIREVGLLLPSQRTSQKVEVQIPTQLASFTCTYKRTPQGHGTHQNTACQWLSLPVLSQSGNSSSQEFLRKQLCPDVQGVCLTLCDPKGCSPPGSSVRGDSPGENTGGDAATAAAYSLQSCPTLCDPMEAACQALLSMAFSRQGYWSGLPCPPPGDPPDPGIEAGSPALQADSLCWATREAHWSGEPVPYPGESSWLRD